MREKYAKWLSFMFVLFVALSVTRMVFAQDPTPLPSETFDLTPYFTGLIGNFAPILVYVLTFFAKQGLVWLNKKIPSQFIILIPMVLSFLIGVVQKLADGSTENAVFLAFWAMLAVVIQEVQQNLAKMLTGGESTSLGGATVKLFSK